MQRRTVVQALALPLLASSIAQSKEVEKGELDYEDYAGDLPNLKLYGDKPALPAETRKAREMLDLARQKTGVIEVARYFESISETNDQGEKYNAAWASRWNPVIIGFYKSTTLADKYVFVRGDTIAWCAAFLNWCLEAAGKPTTKSASSGSFRTYGAEVKNPKAGDIVVFKNSNPVRGNAGFGHVGLFVEQRYNSQRKREEIVVLGGNQKAGKRYSSVNTSAFPLQSDVNTFHSFRRV